MMLQWMAASWGPDFFPLHAMVTIATVEIFGCVFCNYQDLKELHCKHNDTAWSPSWCGWQQHLLLFHRFKELSVTCEWRYFQT